MNTLKTVYNKLFKEETNLSTHEVDLSIKDDIEKTVANYEAISKKLDLKINKFYDNVFMAKKSFEDLKGDANSLFVSEKELLSEKLKAIALGKELGIDVTSAPFYKELIAALNRLEDIRSEYSSASLLDKSIKI
jgi:uncharacterized protein (DUF111 family)